MRRVGGHVCPRPLGCAAMRLGVATCQFPTGSSIRANLGHVLGLMREAKARGGDVAHFPEACLSGYAGADIPSHEGFDWPSLAAAVHAVLALAGELRLWVVLGRAHRLTGGNKPHNSPSDLSTARPLRHRVPRGACVPVCGGAARGGGPPARANPGAWPCGRALGTRGGRSWAGLEPGVGGRPRRAIRRPACPPGFAGCDPASRAARSGPDAPRHRG